MAGGVADGAALWAAQVAGYDLGFIGTRLIPTTESAADMAVETGSGRSGDGRCGTDHRSQWGGRKQP
jgi:hypothetical protein